MNKPKRGWHRKEWVTNPSDPTMMVKWELRWKFIHIKLVGSWGAELTVWIGGWKYSSYDSWEAKKLWNFLEDRHYSQL